MCLRGALRGSFDLEYGVQTEPLERMRTRAVFLQAITHHSAFRYDGEEHNTSVIWPGEINRRYTTFFSPALRSGSYLRLAIHASIEFGCIASVNPVPAAGFSDFCSTQGMEVVSAPGRIKGFTIEPSTNTLGYVGTVADNLLSIDVRPFYTKGQLSYLKWLR